ncbi:MAG TPA: NUDIX hydrolase [Ktedonobacterales bacterium]
MLTFDTDRGRFNVRAAGVCVEDGYVLAQQFDGSEFWVLPGGRIEMGEDSANALAREMSEELPITDAIRIERLLWITELFFNPSEGEEYHELGFYYLMRLPAGHALQDKSASAFSEDAGARFELRWLPLDALGDFPIVPYFLRTELLALPGDPRHMIIYEER